ncbi:MAG: hypothetical protein Ct9H300mP11_17700 [Chloroflexota bacterium]|nr:MAG: hypothetical protein Ct9H300mP11_17700 [Chloroflexota bacterium]
MGIGQAAFEAMMRAVGQLKFEPGHLLLDFIHVRECSFSYETIVKGDSKSYSIAAASNVAKITRDRVMVEAEETYPGYGNFPDIRDILLKFTLKPRKNSDPARFTVGLSPQ